METMVGHPRMWDLKKLPYLHFYEAGLIKNKQKNPSYLESTLEIDKFQECDV